MIDAIKTLDTIEMARYDVQHATPVSQAARAAMAEALNHLYWAEEAYARSLREDGIDGITKVTP